MASDGHLNFDTRINTTGFQKGLKGLKDLASKGLGGLKNLSVGIAKSMTAASVAVGGLGAKCISLASDLAEVQNVVDVTFGDSAEKINKWSKEMATGFGIGELQAKQFAGTMGAMVKSMGLSDEATEQMATNLTELSGDFASFYNLKPEEAFEKIRAGISGETEPLKQLGINMSVANLEAYALSQGISKAYDEMSQAEQATLRYNYLLSVSSDAQGDFSRTSDSLANQLRILQLNLSDLGSTIGTTLIPAAQSAMKELNSMVTQLKDAFVTGGFEGVAAQLGKMLADLMVTVADYAPKFIGMGMTIIKNLVDGIQQNIGRITQAAFSIINSLAQGIGSLLPQLIDIGGTIITELCDAIALNAPKVVDGAFSIIEELGDGIKKCLPHILDAGKSIIVAVSDGIKEHLPGLVDGAMDIVISIAEYILDNMDEITECAIKIIEALAEGLVTAAVKLYEKAPEIVDKLADGIVDSAQVIFEEGKKLGEKLVEGVMDIDWQAIEDYLAENWQSVLSNAWERVQMFANPAGYLGTKIGESAYEKYTDTGHKKGGSGKSFAPEDMPKYDVSHEMPEFVKTQELLEKAVDDTGEALSKDIEYNALELTDTVEEETKKVADIESNLLYKKSDELISLEGKLQEQENAAYESDLAAKEKIGLKAIHEAYKKYTDAEAAAIKKKTDKVSALEIKQQANATLLKNAQAMAETDEAYKVLTAAELKAIADKSEDTQKLNLEEIMKGQKEITIEQLKAITERNQQVYEMEARNLDAESNIQQQMINSYSNTYKTIVSEYENAYNTILNKQESLANKLKAFGDLFDKVELTINEKGDTQEFMKLGDLQEDVQQLRLLSSGIEELRKRGVSQEFMDNFLSTQSVEDSLDYTELLLTQNDKTLQDYLNAWEEKQKLADEISQGFYQSEVDNLKENFTDKVKDELGLMPDEANQVGKDTANSLAEGLLSGVDAVKYSVQALVGQMQAAVSGETGKISANVSSTVTQDVQTKDTSLLSGLNAIYSALTANGDSTPIYVEMDGKLVGEGSVDGTLRELKRRGIGINVAN